MRRKDSNLERKHKAKFNKEKCATCQYRGAGSVGYPVKINNLSVRVHCNYAGITNSTCLKPLNNVDVVDLRGEDYNNCKLYKRGAMIENDSPKIIVGAKRYDSQ